MAIESPSVIVFLQQVTQGYKGRKPMAEPDLHHIGVDHILPWQKPMFYIVRREDGADVEPGVVVLQQRVCGHNIGSAHRPQTSRFCCLKG